MPTSAFFTYCWVMVEPPPAVVSPVIWPSAARAKPEGENPELVQKSRSSAAKTASWTSTGTDSKATCSRLPSGGTRRASSFSPSLK